MQSGSKMQQQALVLALDNFQGSVNITNCTFTDNYFRYDTCAAVNETLTGEHPVNYSESPASFLSNY